jgi:hypothetical protein
MPASAATKTSTKTSSKPDADATTTVIARLRSQLGHAGVIDHPSVRRELRKLDELLASQFDQTGHKPGRHRSPRVEYELTPMGRTLIEPAVTLAERAVEHDPDIVASHEAYDSRRD